MVLIVIVGLFFFIVFMEMFFVFLYWSEVVRFVMGVGVLNVMVMVFIGILILNLML